MTEGYLEQLGADGLVRGWAWQSSPTAALVQVHAEGEVVAEGQANRFRADLLRAGIGHGHHAFRLRLRRRLVGRVTLGIVLPRAGLRVGRATVMEAPDAPPAAATVESLLDTGDPWTVADLRAHPACLDPPGTLARMGLPRFIDALTRFALDRWPTPGEAAAWTRLLGPQRLDPAAFLLELLTQREADGVTTPLLSPHDPRFPLLLV